jgi:Zn-finger nucleic acid-binding protein
MVRNTIKKYNEVIFTDKCPECSGVWLDGGEINVLRNKFVRNLADKNEIIKNMVKIFYK